MATKKIFRASVLLAMVSLLSWACSGGKIYVERLGSESPIVRMKACAWLGKHRVVEAVPTLVERLDDPDEAVRMVAHQALIDITGIDSGYESWAEPQERKESAQEYLSWWQEKSAQAARPSQEVERLEKGGLRKSD